MTGNGTPAVQAGDQKGVSGPLHTVLDKPTLTFAPKRTRTHSKQCKDLNRVVDCARGQLAAGQSVSEIYLCEQFSTSRYRRRESVCALRILNRMYPKHTSLVIVGGIWTLYPVSEACLISKQLPPMPIEFLGKTGGDL